MTIWREILTEMKRGAVEATTDYWKGIKLLWKPFFYGSCMFIIYSLAFETILSYWWALAYCVLMTSVCVIPPLYWEHTHGGIKLTGPNNEELQWVNRFNSILRSRWKRLKARL